MTLQRFFESYEGLWIETNKAGAETEDQCIDLWRAYHTRVLGGQPVFGNAVEMWEKYPQDVYDRISNTPTGVPKAGDVIIWGTKYGPYGHIAVCTALADTKGFTSFDQNDPLKSPCHFQSHTYTGVLGWLRPKSLPEEPKPFVITDQTKLPILDEQGNEMEVQAVRSKLGEFKSIKSRLDGLIENLNMTWGLPIGSDEAEILTEAKRFLMSEDVLSDYRNSIEQCVGTFPSDSALLEAHTAVRKQIDTLSKERDDLIQKLADCKQPSGYKFLKSWTIYRLLFKLYRKEVI